MKTLNVALGSVILALMTSAGFVLGLAQVDPEPTIVETISLKSDHIVASPDKAVRTIADKNSPARETETDNQSENPQMNRTIGLMYTQFESLNKKVDELQERIDQLSGENVAYRASNGNSDSVANQSANQLAEREQNAINKIFSKAYQALNEEEYDADWTTTVGSSLSNLVSNNDLSDIVVKVLHCGTTLCRATLRQSQADTGDRNILLENLAWQGFRLRVREMQSIDGTNDIEILIGRDGTQFITPGQVRG